MTLSDTQSLILSKASQHERGLAAAPQGLPAAARDAVFRSMLKNGLLAEVAALRGHAGLDWRQDGDGTGIALRITDAGLRAIGIDPHEETEAAPAAAPAAEPAPKDVAAAEAAQDAPTGAGETARAESLALLDRAPAAPTRSDTTLRRAARAVLDTWDDGSDRDALAEPIERLRAVLAGPVPAARKAGAPRGPREGTKRERVLAMLRRPGGASGPQLAEATGWAPHTVRGFLAGLRRTSTAVTVLERVRQVGPNKDGAKGSYTVYHVAGAA